MAAIFVTLLELLTLLWIGLVVSDSQRRHVLCIRFELLDGLCDLLPHDPQWRRGRAMSQDLSQWTRQSFTMLSKFDGKELFTITELWTHPVQNTRLTVRSFCLVHDLSDELCSTVETAVDKLSQASQTLRVNIIGDNIPTFMIHLADVVDRDSKIRKFCVDNGLSIDSVAKVLLDDAVVSLCSGLLTDFLSTRDAVADLSNVWEFPNKLVLTHPSTGSYSGSRIPSSIVTSNFTSLLVVHPPAYLKDRYSDMMLLMRGGSEATDDIAISTTDDKAISTTDGIAIATTDDTDANAADEIDLVGNKENGGQQYDNDDCRTSRESIFDRHCNCNSSSDDDLDNSSTSSNSNSDRCCHCTAAGTSSCGTTTHSRRPPSLRPSSFPPNQSSRSLHVLLATHGRRPELFGMLASLKTLDSRDYLTIVFDGLAVRRGGKGGSSRPHSEDHHTSNSNTPASSNGNNEQEEEDTAMDNNSSRSVSAGDLDGFVHRVYAYAHFMLNCSVSIHIEAVPLGYWGHGVRNSYRDIIATEGGDFVLHVDDDDMILPGAIETIKTVCVHTNTLYLFRVRLWSGRNPFWNVPGIIRLGNVGTPSGVVPMAANKQSLWGLKYGGDFDYYASVVAHVDKVVFVDEFIYQCMPSGGTTW